MGEFEIPWKISDPGKKDQNVRIIPFYDLEQRL